MEKEPVQIELAIAASFKSITRCTPELFQFDEVRRSAIMESPAVCHQEINGSGRIARTNQQINILHRTQRLLARQGADQSHAFQENDGNMGLLKLFKERCWCRSKSLIQEPRITRHATKPAHQRIVNAVSLQIFVEERQNPLRTKIQRIYI